MQGRVYRKSLVIAAAPEVLPSLMSSAVNRDFLPPCYRKYIENSTASSMKDFHEAFSTESCDQLHRTDKFRHVVLKCKECVKSHPEFKLMLEDYPRRLVK